jgi:DNA-binding GntR family transcriptional regulator
VEVIPYKGARVVKASPQDIEDMYAIVGVLEGYAAKLATPLLNNSHLVKLEKLNEELQKEELKRNPKNWLKANNQFHRTFTDACQRPNLINAIYEKIGPLGRYWQIMISMPGIMDDGINDHSRIIDAFESKDSKLIRKLVEKHRIISGRRIKKYIEV